MTSAEQKYVLKLACACDRLELALAHCPPPVPAWRKVIEMAGASPLLELATSTATLFLPRKLRILVAILRSWRPRD